MGSGRGVLADIQDVVYDQIGDWRSNLVFRVVGFANLNWLFARSFGSFEESYQRVQGRWPLLPGEGHEGFTPVGSQQPEAGSTLHATALRRDPAPAGLHLEAPRGLEVDLGLSRSGGEGLLEQDLRCEHRQILTRAPVRRSSAGASSVTGRVWP